MPLKKYLIEILIEMTDFTNNRPPAHVRMGDSEEDKYDNETMADEERQGR